MSEAIPPERARELAAEAYGEASAKFLSAYVVPFIFGRVDRGGVGARNGSAFFIRTPKGVFGVTADHVIRGCLEASGADNFVCGVFPVEYSAHSAELVAFGDIGERIIDRSERRDVATFRVTADELRRLKVSVVSKWPPIPPEPGKGIAICGFPSDRRAREVISVAVPRRGAIEITLSFRRPWP